MADDLPLNEVNHILRDVGRVVGDSLQMPGGREERQTRLHHGGRFPHQLDQLSMGMTNDFEIAIEEGATLVRIGTALFEGTAEAQT